MTADLLKSLSGNLKYNIGKGKIFIEVNNYTNVHFYLIIFELKIAAFEI